MGTRKNIDRCRLVQPSPRPSTKCASGQLSRPNWSMNVCGESASSDDQIRAWVVVDKADVGPLPDERDRQSRAGEIVGPLHGIPIGIKDIIDVAGLPTLAGAPWRSGHIAERDAPLVARARAAGAVILGKTVTTQFASHRSSGDAQSLEPGPHAGRIEQRLGGGRRGRDVLGRHGHSNRRLRDPAGGVLRHRRRQADVRQHRHDRRVAVEPASGHRRRDGDLRRRCASDARRAAGSHSSRRAGRSARRWS